MNTSTEIHLKLYFIEKSPTAGEFVLKLRSFLDSNLKTGYTLEVIDILTHPEKAIQDNILASPTLVKEKPIPPKRIVGGVKWDILLKEFNLLGLPVEYKRY